MGYPPEPWSLRGQMYLSVWALPVREVPPIPPELDGAVRVLRIGGRAFIGAAWVDYQPGGDMAYHELLAAVLMRQRLAIRMTITHIWVDSADSRDGARKLWGIPKEMARFTFSPQSVAAHEIASATVRPRRGVRMPIRFRVTQALDGRPLTSPVRATASCGPARVVWQIDPAGPLGFLAGRRPLFSLAANDFHMRFGQATISSSATAA